MNDFAPSPTDLLRLLGAGLFKMTSTVPGQPQSQSVWILELIVAGEMQVSIEGSCWRPLGRGAGVLYAPGTRYREKLAAPDTICRSLCLFFALSTRPPQKVWERFAASHFIIDDAERLLMPLAERTRHHLGLSAADDLLATGCFMEIVAHLLRAREQNRTLVVAHEYSGDNDLVARTHRFMQARLGQPLTLPEIAAEMGLSVSGFAHAYKRRTGLSPMVTLRQMRVEAVKSQLLRDRLSLAQIAAETGFADAFHLSRIFKQTTGVSPRQFRSRVLGSPSRQPGTNFSSHP